MSPFFPEAYSFFALVLIGKPFDVMYDSFLEVPICQSTGGNHMLSIWYYGFNHSAGLAEAAFYLAFIGTSPCC